jgi:hypothetical protein
MLVSNTGQPVLLQSRIENTKIKQPGHIRSRAWRRKNEPNKKNYTWLNCCWCCKQR